MENQETGSMVGLGTPKAEPRADAQPTAPAPGLTGLGAKGGLTGLGAGSSLTGLGGGSSLTGLGSSRPASPAPAPAAAPAAPKKSGITIAESAAERIQKLLADRGTPAAGLRIRVRGGGCTGLQYDMEFADEAKEKDRVFEGHGVKIFVDPKSYIFLIGTELTYTQGLLESGFKLENPNVKKACGCGESFTV